MKNVILLICLAFSLDSFSQSVNIAAKLTGLSDVNGYKITVDNNGDIIVTGRFFGSVDFDPSAATSILTSNGSSDIFLAKYSSQGQLLWAFNIGSNSRDAGYKTVVDEQNNIYLTGFFRGNVDFDPSDAESVLISNGEAGSDPGWSGEIFVAKYDVGGNYKWAFNIGGATLGDDGQDIVMDHNGDLIVGGYFNGNNVDFDPSATGFFGLTSAHEDLFLAKFTRNGGLIWAINMGGGIRPDESVRQVAVDKDNQIYITGFFSSSADFDPGAGVYELTASSLYEGFVAKYDQDGNFIWAHQFGGIGFNQGWGIDVDDVSGRVFVTGMIQGPGVRFTGSAGTTSVKSFGETDVFIAKYSFSGNLIFAKSIGSPGADVAYDIAVDVPNECFYITGFFSGSSNFDEGGSNYTLNSNGGMDIFVAKYLLDGSYSCGFNIGSTLDDYTYGITVKGPDIFVVGSFKGTNVDFDPSSSNLLLSSDGGFDGFFAGYRFTKSTADGEFTAEEICRGDEPAFVFDAFSGSEPFTLVLSDGFSTFTKTDIKSGVQFTLPVTPDKSTTYTLVSISDANKCSQPNPVNYVVNVDVQECCANIAGTLSGGVVCSGELGVLVYDAVDGQGQYSIEYTDGQNVYAVSDVQSGISFSTQVPLNGTTTFTLIKVTDQNGCTGGGSWVGDTATIEVNMPTAEGFYATSNQSQICLGDSAILTVEGAQLGSGSAWVWTKNNCDGDRLGSGTFMVVKPTSDTYYYVKAEGVCNTTNCSEVLITVKDPPDVTFEPLNDVCEKDSRVRLTQGKELTGSTGIGYYFGEGVSNDGFFAPQEAGLGDISLYYVFETSFGCKDSASQIIKVKPTPVAEAGKDVVACPGSMVRLNAKGGSTYQWSPVSGLSNSTIPDPEVSVTGDQKYFVTVTNELGCSSVDSVQIVVSPGGKMFGMPSAFTPNNDGLNDCFGMKKWGDVDLKAFRVYNRWGELVFSANSPNDCWDGKYKGIPQTGVFVYYVQANTACGDVFLKGTVMVIR